MALRRVELARILRLEEPVGSQRLTVGAAVVGLTVPPLAVAAVCQAETATVRMTLDGTTPAAARGIRWTPGDLFRLEGFDTLRGARFVREGAADGVLEVIYFTYADTDADERTLPRALRAEARGTHEEVMG